MGGKRRRRVRSCSTTHKSVSNVDQNSPLCTTHSRSDSSLLSLQERVARFSQSTLEKEIESGEQMRFVLSVDVLDSLIKSKQEG